MNTAAADEARLALEADAAALARTVEVLKRKVIALNEGTDKTALQRQLERSQHRSEAIQRKRELSEIRTAELERYGQQLEATVAERTRTIHRIIDNVACGFLVVNDALVVEQGFTKSCLGLFQTTAIANQRLSDVLGLSATDKDYLEVGIAQVFEDILPPDVTLAQLPGRYRVRDKVLELQYRAVYAGQRIEGILITITDATHLEEVERTAHSDRVLIGILRQREAFRAFVSDAIEQLEAARRRVSEQAFVRRVVHTIKGNAACYDLIEVADFAHRIEEFAFVSEHELTELEGALRAFLSRHRDLLGIDLASGAMFEVPEPRVRALRAMTERPSLPPALRRWAAEVSLKAFRDLCGPLDGLVVRLADRLGKDVRLELVGGDVLIDAVNLTPIVAVLPHLLRNALDHGIEPPEARGTKPARARIVVAASETEDEWRLTIEDDGAGIDVKRVVERAIELGIVTLAAAANLDERARCQLIFADRLSTKSEVTAVSGRGVGVSAVYAAVQQAHGRMSVESERGAYTRFIIQLPKPPALRSAVASPSAATDHQADGTALNFCTASRPSSNR